MMMVSEIKQCVCVCVGFAEWNKNVIEMFSICFDILQIYFSNFSVDDAQPQQKKNWMLYGKNDASRGSNNKKLFSSTAKTVNTNTDFNNNNNKKE